MHTGVLASSSSMLALFDARIDHKAEHIVNALKKTCTGNPAPLPCCFRPDVLWIICMDDYPLKQHFLGFGEQRDFSLYCFISMR